MKHASRPQSIAWFQDHYKAGRLELRPPFQRKPVWTDKQRSFLVESILLDIPIPEIYIQVNLNEEGVEQFGVVDGQQRLRTILQFIGIESIEDQHNNEDWNHFSLDKLPEESIFYERSFADLSMEKKKEFFQYEICVRLLYTDNRADVEDVFKRLNKYTLPLRPQELRNATYHGPFAKLSEELANDPYWAINRIISPAAIRRMADIEMMSDLLIGLIHGPQGGAAKIIDEYYEEYEVFDDEIPSQGKIKRKFSLTLSAIQSVFPNISAVPRWGNRADFYSLFIAFSSQLTAKLPARAVQKKIAADLVSFAEEVDRCLTNPAAKSSESAKVYARAIEKGSNDKARRADRDEVLKEIIGKRVRAGNK